MWRFLILAVVGISLYSLGSTLLRLRRNIAAAKLSGIPYVVAPVLYIWLPWRIVGIPILKLLRATIPAKWQGLWLEFLEPGHIWSMRYSRFERVGSDMWLLVTPQGNWLAVADAEAIAQITQRRNDFPKPISMYGGIDIFGKNVVTTEGQFWRHHRRIVAPPFNEANNHLVWAESLYQTQSMLKVWVGAEGNDDRPVETLAEDAMRLSLYVISKAGFGRRMEWPAGLDKSVVRSTQEHMGEKPDKGHSMAYTEALQKVLSNTILLVALPMTLLRWWPSDRLRSAATAFDEWQSYMEDLYAQKQKELSDEKDDNKATDLMSGLVRAAGNIDRGEQPLLSRDEIRGNAFVILLAGHETTANSIHFSLIFLATALASQRRAQSELDQIFGEREISEWSYDKDLPRLFGGILGAVLAEELRLVPPVVDIPKYTVAPQSLTVRGKRYVVPANTAIGLCSVGVHRNPRYWPHGPPRDAADPEHPVSNTSNDLEEFKPERWLPAGYLGPAGHQGTGTGTSGASAGERTAETDELGVNTAADTAASLFKPERGAYIPFSEGYRSCLGRRFAQVEFLAVMAAILKTWSVELDVSRWATDADLLSMTAAQKRLVWNRARAEVRHHFNQRMVAKITLQFQSGHGVPLRFVKRGCERFDWRD